MSIEEDWAVQEIKSLTKRVKRLEDETGITEADRKEAKERREAERAERREADEAAAEADEDGTVKLSPRERAARQAEVDTQAQGVQARADNDGPAGITNKSRAKVTDGDPEADAKDVEGQDQGPTKDPQNEGDDVDATKGDDPEPLFDPTRHTVGEVNAHLDKSDPAERDRVLAAERAGANRSRIKGT